MFSGITCNFAEHAMLFLGSFSVFIAVVLVSDCKNRYNTEELTLCEVYFNNGV